MFLGIKSEVIWNKELANTPVLYLTLPQSDLLVPEEDRVWDFVFENSAYYIKCEILPGFWEFASVRMGKHTEINVGFKGGAGRQSSYKLSDGRVIVSKDVWSSNPSAVSSIFGLQGDDRITGVRVYCESTRIQWMCLGTTHRHFRDIVESLGLKTYVGNRGELSPSLSETDLVKEP